jgi:hypothetical protein
MFDTAWKPGVDFASGLSAYYVRREAHYRRLADAAYSEWQEQSLLAGRYRLLAEKAALSERLAACE